MAHPRSMTWLCMLLCAHPHLQENSEDMMVRSIITFRDIRFGEMRNGRLHLGQPPGLPQG